MAKQHLSIGEAALMLGLSVTTLRRWHKDEKLTPNYITKGGHRRYSVNQLVELIHPNKGEDSRLNIGYARVSSHDQKKDLEVQKQRLQEYGEQFSDFEVMSDLGSGLNYKKKGLRNLIQLICQCRVKRLVLVHKDRLLRFGSELIFLLCQHFGTEVNVLEEVEETFENQLCYDVIELMTVFSARLYGKRSRKNLKSLKKTA